MKSIKFILFDLDGTLVDSLADLTFCVDAMLKFFDLSPSSEEKVCYWIGHGAESLINQALTEAVGKNSADTMHKQAVSVFMDVCKDNLCVRTKLYPQVREALTDFKSKNYKLGCVTNKPESLTRSLLDLMEMNYFFDVVVGGDTMPKKKPDPLPLLFAIEKLGFDPEEGIMVGDSLNDIQAAKNAKIKSVAVTYGYNYGKDIRESNPDWVIEGFGELMEILKSTNLY